jgi:glutaminyl-peptide cyclotransferase
MKNHIMNANTTLPVLMACLFLSLVACTSDSSSSKETTDEEKKEAPVSRTAPAVSGDSAYAFVERQVAFGPRNPGSRGHAFCKEWLSDMLRQYADTVILQNFKATTWDKKTLESTNIMGVFNPEATQRILLAAHWDTRVIAEEDSDPAMRNKPILGADDGGSGVGVLLEIARQLSVNRLGIGVDIVFFDAEDQGNSGGANMESWCLGSQHWSRNLPWPGYKPLFGILLDMVGSKTPRFTKEAISMNFAPDVMNRVWQIAAGAGYGGYFVMEESGPITDDHYFVNTIARIPMINIINRPVSSKTGFGDYWHTHNDNMDIIERKSLQAVGQVVLQTLYQVDEGTF